MEYVYTCSVDSGIMADQGVLVDVQGKATNRWEDGTVGVPEDLKAWIQMDDCAPECPVHLQGTEWRDY